MTGRHARGVVPWYSNSVSACAPMAFLAVRGYTVDGLTRHVRIK